MSLAKEVEELQRKAGSYNLLKEEYDKLLDRIKELRKGVDELLKSSGYVLRPRGTYISTKNLMYDIYEEMKVDSSKQLTREALIPRLRDMGVPEEALSKKANSVLTRMQKLDGIRVTKDGGKLRLFYSK